MLEIRLDDESAYDLVRDAVVRQGLGLLRLEQRRHSMSELFRPAEGAAGVPA